MKWPETLTLIRHAESAYNRHKLVKEDSELYQKFKKAYNKDPLSPNCKEIALEVVDAFPVKVGDHDTPLADEDNKNSRVVGQALRNRIELPDVIFVSPYERTHQTLNGLVDGWPELRDVKIVEEERLREQEHGLSLLYWDWRVFNTLHPEQKILRDLQGSYWYRYPQGENVPDVRERVRSWLGSLTRDYIEQNVLGVSHHLSILSLRANLERLNAQEFERLDKEEKPINLGATIYRGDASQGSDGKMILDAYNIKLY